MIERARHGIIGHHQIQPAIIVHIDKHGGETVVPLRVVDSCFLAYIRERAIAAVVEQVVAFPGQAAGPAHGEIHTAVLASA